MNGIMRYVMVYRYIGTAKMYYKMSKKNITNFTSADNTIFNNGTFILLQVRLDI